MSSHALISPPDGDPSFHGSVHTATLTVCTVLVMFVVILGTFGNGVVLLSALQCRKRRSNVDLLIFHLAGTDFIICSCVSPTFLYLLFSNPHSTREFCGGLLFASTTCGLLSLLTLAAIAAHRGSRVRGRIKSGLGTVTTACILTAIYLVSVCTSLGGTLHVTLSWAESYTTCQAVMNSGDITITNIVLYFISPIVIIAFFIIFVCYCYIARAIRIQTYLRVKALQPFLKSADFSAMQTSSQNDKYKTPPEVQNISKEKFVSSMMLTRSEPLKHCSCCTCLAALDRENKAITMCFVVTLVLALCWTPLVISHFIEIMAGQSITLYQVKLCGIALVFLNSALNPYMYAPSNGRMRKRYGRFFWDILHCDCRISRHGAFKTLTQERKRSRTLRRPGMDTSCAALKFLYPRSRNLFKSEDNNINMNMHTKDHQLDSTHRKYTRNIIFCGNRQLSASLNNKPGEMGRPRTLHKQVARQTDVQSLVQKKCCYVPSPDDHSLLPDES